MALPRDRRALRRLVPLVRRLDAESVDGESPDTAAACSIRLRRKLPANHDLADVRAAELPAGRAGFCELREVAYGWERTSSRPRNRPGWASMPGPCLPRLVISGVLECLPLCSALHGPPPSGFDLQSACANALSFGAPLEPAPANERRILVYMPA